MKTKMTLAEMKALVNSGAYNDYIPRQHGKNKKTLMEFLAGKTLPVAAPAQQQVHQAPAQQQVQQHVQQEVQQAPAQQQVQQQVQQHVQQEVQQAPTQQEVQPAQIQQEVQQVQPLAQEKIANVVEKEAAPLKKKKGKKELIAIAEKLPGWKKSWKIKNIKDLEEFIQRAAGSPVMNVGQAPPVEEEKKKMGKKELLIAQASKIPGFRISIQGKNMAELKKFIAAANTGAVPPPLSQVEEEEVEVEPVSQEYTRNSILGMNEKEAKKLAKTEGWNGRKDRIKDAKQYLLNKFNLITEDEEEKEEAVVEIVEWPISVEEIRRNSGTIKALKELLIARGIATSLPRTKEEILKLFNKSRCDFDNFTCNEDEFCDLRNQLCRELDFLREEGDDEIKKFAKGLIYLPDTETANRGRFYGTREAIHKVKTFLANKDVEIQEEDDDEIVPPSIMHDEHVEKDLEEAVEEEALEEEDLEEEDLEEEAVEEEVVEEEAVEEEVAPVMEEGISPININNLLNKHSENEIRKAILNCLGLYNDRLDPNDEIVHI